jgi:hypothetical protein
MYTLAPSSCWSRGSSAWWACIRLASSYTAQLVVALVLFAVCLLSGRRVAV